MAGVLTGFAVIGTIIAIGYVIGRIGLLGEDAPRVMSRLVFFVLSPCLLFTVLADADVHALFSSTLAVAAIAAIFCIALFAGIALLVFRQKLPETVIGSLASGYVNANNIGLPVAVYVLGDPAYSAPVLLLQLLVFTPISLTLLDYSTQGSISLRRVLSQPLRNPLIIGSALGVILSVTGTQLPDPVMEPFRIVGAAAVPVVLIGYGMSLHGQKVLAAGTHRREVILASILKLFVMPAVAWVAGLLFGLDDQTLRAVVILAALPSAQNVFNYAQRYGAAVILARDAVLITTIGSLPVLLVVSLLLQ